MRFLKPGAAVTRTLHARADQPPEHLGERRRAVELGEGRFSADIQVLNYQPIAVEKAMYWDADGEIWAAGTNVTATRLPPR